MGVSSASGAAYQTKLESAQEKHSDMRFIKDATKAVTNLRGLENRMSDYRDNYVEAKLGLANITRVVTELENLVLVLTTITGSPYNPVLGVGRYEITNTGSDYPKVTESIMNIQSVISRHIADVAVIMRTNKQVERSISGIITASAIPNELDDVVKAAAKSENADEAGKLLTAVNLFINREDEDTFA